MSVLSCGSNEMRSQAAVAQYDFNWREPVNITNHRYWDFDPAFSPDGSLIAFHSTRPPSPGNVGQIYVMNADGSGPRALTHTEGANYGAEWSPDGAKIAFTSERDGNPEAYIMNADGSEQINTSNNPDAYDAGPTWSPNGRYIAYASGSKKPAERIPPGSPYRYWNSDIYILDTDTGERTRVTTADNDDIYPVWSHDGTRLAFTSSRDGNNEIYIINTDGTGERRITNHLLQDNAAFWLPGDRSLSFNRSEEIDGEYLSEIYVADLQTGSVSRVTDRPEIVYFNGPLSPDTSTIAYAAFTKDPDAINGERADIYLVERE